MKTVQLIYTDRRGASVIKGLPYDNAAIERAMSRLYRNARLMLNGQDIGAVWHDGKRWLWYYERAD